MPRIISGENKGMRLNSLDTNETRPTMDRIKESIFNILQNSIFNAKVLDLYAGTGQIGIEAVARGANKAVFVDNNKNAIKIIKSNIEKTGFNSYSELYKMDVIDFLENTEESFDIIYIDPPYFKGLYDVTFDCIDKKNILKPKGIIITEHDYNIELKNSYGTIELMRIKEYGKTIIRFYGKRVK